MSATFTPGPWEADRTCVRNSGEPHRFTCGLTRTAYATSEEMRANARLIAAAPDLLSVIGDPDGFHDPLGFLSALVIDLKERLEASKVFRVEWEGDDPESAWECLHEVEVLIDRGRAALAKARGDQ